MDKALITTVPFGDENRLPLELLEEAGIEYLINPLGRKLTEQELADIIPGFEVLISGTEPITNHVMQRGKNLKMISRVGIGKSLEKEVPEAEYAVQREGLIGSGSMDVTCEWVKE